MDTLDGGKRSLGRVPGEDIHDATHFTELIPELAGGVEGEVARAATRVNRSGGRSGRREHAAFFIEMKDENLIDSEIGDDDIAIVR